MRWPVKHCHEPFFSRVPSPWPLEENVAIDVPTPLKKTGGFGSSHLEMKLSKMVEYGIYYVFTCIYYVFQSVKSGVLFIYSDHQKSDLKTPIFFGRSLGIFDANCR